MAKAIRQFGLRLLVVVLRCFVRPAPRGWVRSTRDPLDLDQR